MQKSFRTLGVILFLSAAVAGSASTSKNTDNPILKEGSRMATLLANNLPLMHLNKVPWDDQIAERGLDNFLESLDFDRIFFLAEDIAAFKAQVDNLDDYVKRGDLSFAQQVYEVFKQRVTNRVEFAEQLLNQPFDFSVDEDYQWKRKDAPWASSVEEWNDLWRRRMKHLYLSRMINDETGGNEEAIAEQEEDKQSHSEKANAKLSPEDFVRKSLRQYKMVIEDNDETWVIERYLTSFARAFDPHTDFMSPNNMEDFEINMKLSLQGIGAILSSEEGAAKVERLIKGGPAERDGRLKPGDKIIAVAQDDADSVDVLHWPLYKTVRLIRGDKGTRVVLTVIPASDSSGSTLSKIDLIRDEVKLEEQAAKGELRKLHQEGGEPLPVGVITLPDFYQDFKGGGDEESTSCTRDVERILNDLVGQGAKAIILDLRNNGGGSLTEAINLTGLFIPTGPVVQVRDRRRVRSLEDYDDRVVYSGPLIVLVNRLSASASEIVAGALQDYGRAIIVGDSKTHGKGTVQTLANLSNANPQLGSVKVTTASFYRIAGGSTQLKGVIPDIVIPSFVETLEVGEDLLHNALPYSEVPQLKYQQTQDKSEMLPKLALKSEERREHDTRFKSYSDLLNRATERQKSSTVSLQIDKRRAQAASEKELRDQIEEVNPETGKKEDLILSEALNIARDMIDMGGAEEEEVAGEKISGVPVGTL